MSEKTVSLKVFRYKQGDAAPRYQTFQVPADGNTTLLVALQEIRRDQDASLTLRHSCHHASCGTCGMKVNGKEELACVVNLQALGTAEVVVEPLANLPVVSDLVVDMAPFYAKVDVPERPYIRQSEFMPDAEPPAGIDLFTRYENCLECGACVSACPVMGSDPAYLGPAALAAARRVVEEPRDSDPGFALDWADNEHGCWRCHVAYECSEACPSDVDPAGKIMALRRDLSRRKLRRLFGLK
ncbi:MAG: succinate dehydrogenase/fumarate reductase iron-sulfur subunit [Anaerolineales bacterium]|nr:succinate dehydrogenase/fumarate reductase iron-sulfur subunit [Anaerolineales bacterium]